MDTIQVAKEEDTLCPQDVLQKIVPNDVLKVYSGKPGCMCGCLGRYYVTAERLAEANKERGYDYEDRDVSRKMVTKVLRLLQADERTCIQDGYILYVPRNRLALGERSYVVYLPKKRADQCKSEVN